MFSDAEESELEEYILAASKLYYGQTTKDVRNLAYQYAIKNNVTIPADSCDEQHASSDWLSSFLKRKNKFSIRNHKLLIWAEQLPSTSIMLRCSSPI
jgi:hypothetical protein